MPEPDLFAIQRLRVSGTESQVDELLRQLLVEARRVTHIDGRIVMDIAVERGQMELVKRYGLEIVHSIDTADPKRSRRIGTGNRFKDKRIPEGLGELRREA